MQAGKSSGIIWIGLLGVVGLAAISLLLWATPHGIGLYYDSMPYLESAQNLVDGRGLGRITCVDFRPLTRYPPLYSLSLAAVNVLTDDLYSAARYISAVSMGLVCLLVGASLWRMTRNKVVMLVGAGWVLVSAPVLNIFSWAMSEPIYLVLWLASLLVLDVYLTSGNRRHLFGSALLAGLGLLARYVGALPIFASAIVLAIWAWRRLIPWKDLGVYLGVACTPMLGWLLWGSLVAGNPINRAIDIHLPERQVLRQGADTLIGWFGPPGIHRSEEAAAAIIVGIALVLGILFIAVARKAALAPTGSHLMLLHLLSSLAYVSGVIISITFFDPMTPLDDRILIPVYLSLGMVLLTMLMYAFKSRSAPIIALALAAFLALMLRQASQTGDVVAYLRADGQGYAARRWTGSPVGQRLRDLRPALIYTNDITAVYFIAQAASCAVPTVGSEEAMDLMRERLDQDGAVLAVFGELTAEFMPLDRLTEGLVLLEELGDGRIYALRP